MITEDYQHFPFTFEGAADNPVVYAALKQRRQGRDADSQRNTVVRRSGGA